MTGRPSTALFGAALVAGLLLTLPAEAFRAVRRTIEGCVVAGVFTGVVGYRIRVRRRSGEALDLSRWNGRRLRITGNLCPATCSS